MKKKTTNVLLITVSVLLVCVIAVQCLFWAGIFDPKKKADAAPSRSLSREGYTLSRTVVLSRHNIRSPLSGGGSMLDSVTPHEWFKWTSAASELSLRGGVLETIMGQYFRKWMESEGLFPENYRPAGGEVRIYANSKQRTVATAQYFSAGLLPSANFPVEYHMEFDKMDPVFTPQLTFVSPEYRADAEAQIKERFAGVIDGLSDNYALLSDVIDMEDSAALKDGSLSPLVTDDLELKLEVDAEPSMSGSLKTACSISDALVLQYYEQPDDSLAAFGHKLSAEDWRKIGEIKDVYGDVLFTAPLVAPNVAHPLLTEIEAEMKEPGRVFTFLCGHDSNVGSVLACLGVTDYTLPETIEKTPIGCKLVFSEWKDAAGDEYWSVDLVYGSADQLRGVSLLDLDHPPVVYPVTIPDLKGNADGLYPADELFARLDKAVAAYGEIMDRYRIPAAIDSLPTGTSEIVRWDFIIPGALFDPRSAFAR